MDNCIVCGNPVPDYKPVYCCSGYMCGCRGLPIEPPLCSEECERKAYKMPNKEDDSEIKGKDSTDVHI